MRAVVRRFRPGKPAWEHRICGYAQVPGEARRLAEADSSRPGLTVMEPVCSWTELRQSSHYELTLYPKLYSTTLHN
jgi:hypothetical protein